MHPSTWALHATTPPPQPTIAGLEGWIGVDWSTFLSLGACVHVLRVYAVYNGVH